MSRSILIAWPDDKLAGAVAEQWSAQSRPWQWVSPPTLASTAATLEDGALRLEREPVDAVLWRASPESDLSVDFTDEDRVFADTEARSFWLAALNLPSVGSVVRPDAALFFARSGWTYWRDVLRSYGIPLAPVHVGRAGCPAAWLPFASSQPRAAPSPEVLALLGGAGVTSPNPVRVLFADTALWTDTRLEPAASRRLGDAIAVLAEAGLRFGEVTIFPDGVVLTVDAFPRIEAPAAVHALVAGIVKVLDDTADRR